MMLPKVCRTASSAWRHGSFCFRQNPTTQNGVKQTIINLATCLRFPTVILADCCWGPPAIFAWTSNLAAVTRDFMLSKSPMGPGRSTCAARKQTNWEIPNIHLMCLRPMFTPQFNSMWNAVSMGKCELLMPNQHQNMGQQHRTNIFSLIKSCSPNVIQDYIGCRKKGVCTTWLKSSCNGIGASVSVSSSVKDQNLPQISAVHKKRPMRTGRNKGGTVVPQPVACSNVFNWRLHESNLLCDASILPKVVWTTWRNAWNALATSEKPATYRKNLP